MRSERQTARLLQADVAPALAGAVALRRLLAAALTTLATLQHSPLWAAAPLPTGTLPVPSSAWVTSGSATRAISGANLTITQQSQRAVLNWDSFNISSDAQVRFDQPTASAAVLNRIHDANPSLIQGRLSANGDVYLINGNGMLFDGGAQVNVGGLIASALDIPDDTFSAGLLSTPIGQAAFSFGKDADAFARSEVKVAAGAIINSADNGRVMLLAPRVWNAGQISTPRGQTILAGGDKVYLAAPLSPELRGFLVEVDRHAVAGGGSVTNAADGSISALRGNVTAVGSSVRQDGRISATTAVSLNGSIRLLARDTAKASGSDLGATNGGALTLGRGSVTEVVPETDSATTVRDDTPAAASRIELAGRTVHLEREAAVLAHGGQVDVVAQRGELFDSALGAARDDVRIQVDSGARIDVSGLRDIALPVERNVVAVELRGDELKDSPLQRDGVLRNKTVNVDVRVGTALANVTGVLGGIERGIAERSSGGGEIRLRSEGDVILREGALLDVSGGSIAYQGGVISTTFLVGEDGRLYDIGDASPDRQYVALAGRYSVVDPKWGVARKFMTLPGVFEQGYIEGRPAGSIEAAAYRVVLDGELRGATINGPRQRELAARAGGGRLMLGNAGALGSIPNFMLPDFALLAGGPVLGSGFEFGTPGALTPLPAGAAERLVLDPTRLMAGGFQHLEVYANGAAALAAPLALPAGGELRVVARQVDVAADVNAPAGTISLRSRETAGSAPELAGADHGITVRGGVQLAAAGVWSNDQLGDPAALIAPNAGGITLQSTADLILAAGSVLDVTGGGYLNRSGTLVAGEGGDITLASGRFRLGENDPQPSRLDLGATLRGQGLEGGGKLSLAASMVQIGGTPPAEARALYLAPDLFEGSGFSHYAVSGADGLTVAGGTTLAPRTETLLLSPAFAQAPSGSSIRDFSVPRLMPLPQRSAADIDLTAGTLEFGDLSMGAGALIDADPGATVALTAGRQLTVLGQVSAPAGAIRLATVGGGGSDDAYNPGQSIWLGANAALRAPGYANVVVDAQGLRRGEILPGGTVSLTAEKGYVVTEAGSLIDVSGVAGELDIDIRDQPGAPQATLIGSNGGQIAVAAREGGRFDGQLRAAGATGAVGGALSFSLQRPPVSNAGFPTGPVALELGSTTGFVPAELVPGADLPADLNGRLRVGVDRIVVSGAVDLALASRDRVQFAGNVDLALAGRLLLSAPEFGADAGATVNLGAHFLSLGNTGNLQLPRASTPGDARFNLNANTIEFAGQVALQGIGSLRADSAGDLRLRGLLVGSTGRELTGALHGADTLTLRAAQVYPATLTRFTLSAGDLLSVERGGAGAPAPLSAGGALTLEAARIVQAGTLRAPLGTLRLSASQIELAGGSVSSVSGAGLLVPFGHTELAGREWAYRLDSGNELLFHAAPEKAIELSGGTLDLAAGSVLDVTGGGELLAHEFLPGPGGSLDLLANAASSFAVIPALGAGLAPFDHEFAAQGEVAAGDLVWLAGAPGLDAGYYSKLPARYALLPGAFLVTPRAVNADVSAGFRQVQPLGDYRVAGREIRELADGSRVAALRSGLYDVQSTAVLAHRAEYAQTYGSRFFADGSQRLVGDAGRMSLGTTGSLIFDSTLLVAGAAGGRGALLDIAAPRLAVLGGGATAPAADFVTLDIDRLNGLGVQSLLLGGLRSQDGALDQVSRLADRLVVDTDGRALRGADLVFAARDDIDVRSGSYLIAAGPASASRSLVFGAHGDGDGALLRLSAAATERASRQDVHGARGDLAVAAGATLEAAGSLELDATHGNRLDGDLRLVPGAALSLAAGTVSLGAMPVGTPGLLLDTAHLAGLAGLGTLALRSYGTLDLYGALRLGGSDLASLTIETGALRSFVGAGQEAVLQADRLLLGNPIGSSGTAALAVAGTVRLLAREFVLGDGGSVAASNPVGVTLSGMQRVQMQAGETLRLQDRGRLHVQGDLDIAAGVISAQAGAVHTVIADGHMSTAVVPGTVAGPVAGLGARLAFEAGSITWAGNAVLPSGQLRLTASTGDVTLLAGAVLDAAGRLQGFGSTFRAAPAGKVALEATAGDVVVSEGAVVDVRGIAGGDAGSLELTAPAGKVTLAGTLRGEAQADAAGRSGRAADVALDAATLADFGAFNRPLETGRFQGERRIRVRSGDVLIRADDTVTARGFNLVADAGRLDVEGRLDARGPKGGRVVLNAGDELVLASSARIQASALAPAGIGSAGRGGQVELGSATQLVLAAGSVIDVSAGSGASEQQGGQVLLRAPRVGTTDVAVTALAGTVAGARALNLEAVRVYDEISTLNTTGGPGALMLSTVSADNTAFMANTGAIASRLGQAGNALFHLQPGVEVRSAGDLTLAADWNLQPLRAGGEPGVLTLRAGGALKFNGSLSDGFSTPASSGVLQAGRSWSYRLVAGADTAAADPLATIAGRDSDLSLAANKLIRTGTGSIDVVAPDTLVMANNASVIYTAGQRGPNLASDEFSLTAASDAQFPVDGGDLRIAVGGDIEAAAASQLPTAWLYRQGRLNPDGTVVANGNGRAAWWLRFAEFRQGVGALGGGDVDIRAGGSISNLGVSLPTNARLRTLAGNRPQAEDLVVQGGGDLYLTAGGDIGSALIFLGAGEGQVRAGGDVGAAAGRAVNGVALLGDARLSVVAGHSVALDAAVNPTVLTQASANTSGASSTKKSYFFTYGAGTGVDATAIGGNVTLTLDPQAVLTGYSGHGINSNDQSALGMLPPELRATAFSGDIEFGGNAVLYPSATADLELLAARDIVLSGTLAMSDLRPQNLPAVATPASVFGGVSRLSTAVSGTLAHGNPAVHEHDLSPVRLAASRDLRGRSGTVTLVVPKAGVIEAGRDIQDVWLFGQNLTATDITRVVAGRDVRYGIARSDLGALGSSSNRLELGGPGRLEVLAGGDIDLGSGGGIVTRGNLNNPFLPDAGAAVLVMAGLGQVPEYAAFAARYVDPQSPPALAYQDLLIDYLRSRGAVVADAAQAWRAFEGLSSAEQAPLLHDIFFAELRAAGRNAVAVGGDDPARYARGFDAIRTLFPGAGDAHAPYDGDINLFFSQIRTEQGGGIDLFAPGGRANAGLASAGGVDKSASELGIVTARGGSVRAFSDGDFQVNQSRVFTLGGGDILLWSSHGNIDAGRGAKTAAATPPPVIRVVGDQLVLDTSRSISGSGIGVLLSDPTLAPGDVDLIAPNGEVNAGDAGIRSAGNLTIAAPRVVGADNIQVGGVSSGVPAANPGVVSSSVASAAASAGSATKAAETAVAGAAGATASAADGGLGTVQVDVLGFEG